MDVIEVSGRRIAFRRNGSGPPVLFLHGGLSDSREWCLQMEALSDKFDVIAWDAPGCGGSDDPPIDFGMAGYADAVAGLLAALDLGRPHLVGVSFGGGLALAVYERHPDLVGSRRSRLPCAAARRGRTRRRHPTVGARRDSRGRPQRQPRGAGAVQRRAAPILAVRVGRFRRRLDGGRLAPSGCDVEKLVEQFAVSSDGDKVEAAVDEHVVDALGRALDDNVGIVDRA